MLRRLLNTVIESGILTQPESVIYPSPFTQKETHNFGWLPTAAPCFPIKAQNINILHEPKQFYNAILKHCQEAKSRIILVSLYLGNGDLEHNIIKTIRNNDHFRSGILKINVLLDYTRGSRYKNNSRTVLKPLLEENEKNCFVSMYHTPVLRGLKKRLAPARWNEIFGLQHMKLYIFDDTLIISGANLSNDYFTNRQDRYFVIKDKHLCDFYCGLVNRVQSFSLKLDKNDHVGLCEGWTELPYKGDKNKFIEKAGDLIENYLLDVKDEQNIHKQDGNDTWVFPLIQMSQLGVEHDAFVTERLIAKAPKGSKLHIATGYFNLTNKYMKTIINHSEAECKLLMAHPDANGFQGASGPAGGIPAAYSLIAELFKRKFEKFGQGNRITMQEYLRKGWTYHAKGLWYYPPDNQMPCLTLIGSPNFGERSVKRDLETQLAVVTENKELREKLDRECKQLYRLGLPAETNRYVPKWVYLMVYFFRGYF